VAKVLILGDAGAHTGFAIVVENIGNRLVRDYGHDVSCLASNYRGDYWPTDMKLYVPTLLQSHDIYGMSRFVEILASVEPDVVFILNDPHIVLRFLVDNPWDTERILLKYRPLLAYLPIDGYQNPPAWELLSGVTRRVAMSKFGQAAMPGSDLIYHGVDSRTFSPIRKQDAKRALGYDPDVFLVLRTDKNSIRKNYADSWRALRPLMRKYKDIAVHFHCVPNASDGVNLKAFISGDEDIRDRVNFSPNLGGYVGYPDEHLALMYNAADVFISTSMGEGFGLTIAEALACGTPVVASDVSAITEVVGPGGLLISPIRPFAAPMGQDQMLPDVEGFTTAIEKLYMSRGLRRSLGEAGREHVVANFNWDRAAEQFSGLINELAAQTSASGEPAMAGAAERSPA